MRYVAQGIAIVEGNLRALGNFRVLCVDDPEAGDRYYIADHIHWPVPEEAELVYDGGGEWALLRVPEGESGALYDITHFFWPLPDKYSINGWLRKSMRAPKAAQVASPAVAALIAEADAARLQADVEALALKDPALGSVAGNVRSRFAVNPELLESTEYIRGQLAAALGEPAVALHSFAIGAHRVVSYTSRGGRVGQAPADCPANRSRP